MLSKNKIKLIRSLATPKGRLQTGFFLAEGPKIVNELTDAGFIPELIVDNPEDVLRASLLKHPQGVIGVFRQRQPSQQPMQLGEPLSLALDGVQDPGNLGTIIRIADWFGIRNILCSNDTADCWNPKVVQASMGSIARVRIEYDDLPERLQSLPPSCPIYGTLLEGRNIYDEPNLSDKGVVVMGNEGKGISPPVRRLLTHALLVPPFRGHGSTAESLNVAVATAIVCAEFRRREGRQPAG